MTGLTAASLQETLCGEIGRIFEGQFFGNSDHDLVSLNVFEQFLPVRETDDDPDPVPYIVVRLETGTTESDNDPQTVTVTLLFGCFDDDVENNGHRTILGMIQRVQERFQKEPMLGHAFMFQHPFAWAMQDEESFPYFFGAASMTFQTAAVRKEDKYA